MVNDIVNGISTALYSEFGSGYPIYTECVEQGLREPCFFVAVLDGEQSRIVGCRYQQNISVDVHYFPSAKAKNREMRSVAQALYGILERVTLLDGTMINGFQLHDQVTEDVLHFFVTYKPILLRLPTVAANMEDVAVDARMVK